MDRRSEYLAQLALERWPWHDKGRVTAVLPVEGLAVGGRAGVNWAGGGVVVGVAVLLPVVRQL